MLTFGKRILHLTVIGEIFDIKTQEIEEGVLDENSTEVATTVAGYVAKKIIKRSKWESCKILLKVGDVDITNDAYLNILSRGGLFMPSKSHANFLCSNFAILDFVETDIAALSLSLTV